MSMRGELDRLGIKLRSYTPGGHKALCPKCSHRRKHNKREPCLYVRIHTDGTAGYLCFNCGDKGRVGNGIGREAGKGTGRTGARSGAAGKAWRQQFRSWL